MNSDLRKGKMTFDEKKIKLKGELKMNKISYELQQKLLLIEKDPEDEYQIINKESEEKSFEYLYKLAQFRTIENIPEEHLRDSSLTVD